MSPVDATGSGSYDWAMLAAVSPLFLAAIGFLAFLMAGERVLFTLPAGSVSLPQP